MGCMGDAATGKEGRHRGGGWSPGNEGQMGTTACAGEMRWGTHTPEEGLGYDGGGMAHMQAQGGGLERPG